MTDVQRAKLAALLDSVRATNRFYQAKLATVTFDAATDPIERLPFTTRDEIQRDQSENPPYGTNLTFPLERYTRLHQTSGSNESGRPLRWLDTADSWAWWQRCWSTIYDAANVTAAERLVFPFSFGPFIGFWSAFESAAQRGCFCLPAGGMTTMARLCYLLDNGATIVCCTPTYALHMAECAAAAGIDLRASAVRGLIVAGEPGGNVSETRAAIERAWGARVFDHAGMTEMGAWGIEAIEQPDGLFVHEHEFIAECVEPSGTRRVAPGELGELVLTNLGRTGSPLIRYRTGDLVRMSKRAVPPSIRNSRSEFQNRSDGAQSPAPQWSWCDGGVLGRADDMLIIRGNNVFPTAVEGIIRSMPEVAEFRIVVSRSGALTEIKLIVERVAAANAASVADRVASTFKDRLHFRPAVEVVEPGALPRFEMKARRLLRHDAAAETRARSEP